LPIVLSKDLALAVEVLGRFWPISADLRRQL
jgi:hypothetical protein